MKDRGARGEDHPLNKEAPGSYLPLGSLAGERVDSFSRSPRVAQEKRPGDTKMQVSDTNKEARFTASNFRKSKAPEDIIPGLSPAHS